jgi:hypothetical protein
MATPTAKGQLKLGNKSKLLQACQDAYKISEAQYRNSVNEGREVIDLYNNRQYTAAQLATIAENGQPAETFNIIKMFSNAIIGYLESVVNKVSVEPRYSGSAATALLLNDLVDYTLDQNDFETMNKKIKLDGLLTGLMACEEEVVPTGLKDKFGRPLFEIRLNHVPSWQLRLDPHSFLDDYSDARHLHHFKWMPEESLIKLFGASKVAELTEYHNHLDGDPDADYERQFNGRDIGKYKQYNNYLVVRTIIEHNGKIYNVIWCDDVILEQKVITFKEVRFPIRVVKMSASDIAEYYGPFRDITETQKAINQALLQIQLLVNTSKAFVEDNAVENLDEFKALFSRINAIIPVTDLAGIRVEDMSRDIQQQYIIIDQALTRIKVVLGINDSFLGSTFASDSGRKVAMNTASSGSQLTMVLDRVQYLYKMIGTDIVNLIKQYYRGEQIFRIADPLNGAHYVEINKPIQMPTGEIDPNTGEPITSLVYDEEINPETGELMEDDEGNIIVTPLSHPDSAIEFSMVDIKVKASIANNSQERNQLLLETVMNGPAGQVLLQTNPAGYLRTLAMGISEFGTKHSLEVAKVLMDTALGIEQGKVDPRLAMVGGDLQAIMGGAMGGNNGAGGAVGGTMQAKESPTLGIPKPGREGGR